MPDERTQKLAALNGLAANYAATLAPETAKMWLFLLKGYSQEQVQTAVLSMIRKYGTEAVPYKTMPPFALMQRELDALTGTIRGEENIKLQARAEWGRLLEAVEEYGLYREPKFSATTAYVVRSFGGWGQVCRWKMEDLPWRERDFLRLWEQCHGKETALVLGCEAVQSLSAPDGTQTLPEPTKKTAQLLDVTKLSPEHQAARERLRETMLERKNLAGQLCLAQ